MTADSAVTLEYRCPVGPRKLLAKLLAEGIKPPIVDGNLWEFICSDCRWFMRKTDPTVSLVLHRYNILGDFIETEIRHSRTRANGSA